MMELCANAQILRMRYGLHRPDGQGMTLSDVSAAYGITKERVRQLEELAIFKLKRHKDVLTTHLVTAGGANLGEPAAAEDSQVQHASQC